MVEPLKQHEFDKIRGLLESVCGIVLRPDQDYLVETRLTDLANEIGAATFGDLHREIIKDDGLLYKVIDLMTTNETLWFRDDSCWNTIGNVVLPHLTEKLDSGSEDVRIWSAACSTGQEPYSIVILIDEYLKKIDRPELKSRIKILATDISKDAIYMAERGYYDPFTISRGMSEQRLNNYFIQKNQVWRISEEIKKCVSFRVFNLLDSFLELGKFDFVLCRNVAIYFSNTFKTDLFKKISTTFNPNGILIIGATESLFGTETSFQNRSYGNGIYFQLE